MNFFQEFTHKLYTTFIVDERWIYLLNGLRTTLIVTFFAVILGMILGFFIAIVRAAYDKNGKFGFLNLLAKIYLTIIRGSPVVVQLLIIYFVIFASFNIDKTFVLYWRLDLILQHMLQKLSAPVSCLLIMDSLKLERVLA